MQNAISWFEIPSLNLDKSQAFYEAVLGCKMRRENMGPSEGAVFPYDNAAGGVGGALMCGPTAPVTATGTGAGVLVYLDCSPHAIDSLLQRTVAAGGRVAMPHTSLPPGMGFIACIFDLEGNKIGLHAMT
ncbi:MAG: VOC family protein [Burkholderiaceae bacterium]|nr:VOC family protein [Burkholderiaceae bacterium]